MQWYLLHVDHSASIPVADVAVEECATATESSETAVRKQAKDVAHVRDEGYLRYTRPEQGVGTVVDISQARVWWTA